MSKLSVFLLFASLLLTGLPANAQQCGVADSIQYPIDTHVFQLVQDFGAPSPRHQGRYHTGEDWYAGRTNNYGLGTPVTAAANGLVTYSSTTGWGRDGGVVILQHTFPDGSVLYTMYGHMMETDTAKFLVQFSCVQVGQIIGAVGNIRPAPHLHFEVRVSNGTTPGPGYSWDDPFAEGWRQPAKAITNWQAWLNPALKWRLDLADESGPVAPPLELDDHSLLYLDANRLGRVTPDGRSLWRINLERQGIALSGLNNRPLLTYADGSMQPVNIDGTLGERWDTGIALAKPLLIGDPMLFQTPDDAVVAFDTDRRSVLWRATDVSPVVRALQAGQVIGLLTEDHQLLSLSLQGQVLDRAQLRDAASLDRAPNGELRVYSAGGLWAVLADGSWVLDMDGAPPGGHSGAALYAQGGELYLFDGSVLYAYDANRALRWEVRLPEPIGGLTQLSDYGTVLLLTSNHGHLVAIQKESGGICGLTQVFGNDRAQFWHQVGDDGILRVAVSDQIIGFDWHTFLGGCA